MAGLSRSADRGNWTAIVIRFDVEKPGPARFRRTKLFASSPAATSRTIVIASCSATSVDRIRPCDVAAIAVPFSDDCALARRARVSGASAVPRPAMAATPMANAIARQSIAIGRSD